MGAVPKAGKVDRRSIRRSVDPLLRALGHRLKVLRNEAKLSQHELATAAGMRKQFLNRVENGRQNVSIKTLWRLAEALGIPMASLLENVARGR
jgi:transcriptional regulator with XRE-family HTH domain